jgi:hypothetical protein
VALNSVAKSTEAEPLNAQLQSAPAVDAPKTETKANVAPAQPITAEQASALASALKPSAGLSNPVAEVQAKLRAAMAMEVAAQPSNLQNTAFWTMMIASCMLTTLFGVMLGVICVLFGAAMFLFPISAGSALGGFVIAVGALFYFVYTRGVKQNSAKPAETIEPLAAGRFSAAWGA